MVQAMLFASDFSGLGEPFIIPFFLGGVIAFVAAIVIGVWTRWYYAIPAFIVAWPALAVILFVLELGVLFVRRSLMR
jgi:hypothetical protein